MRPKSVIAYVTSPNNFPTLRLTKTDVRIDVYISVCFHPDKQKGKHPIKLWLRYHYHRITARSALDLRAVLTDQRPSTGVDVARRPV